MVKELPPNKHKETETRANLIDETVLFVKEPSDEGIHEENKYCASLGNGKKCKPGDVSANEEMNQGSMIAQITKEITQEEQQKEPELTEIVDQTARVKQVKNIDQITKTKPKLQAAKHVFNESNGALYDELMESRVQIESTKQDLEEAKNNLRTLLVALKKLKVEVNEKNELLKKCTAESERNKLKYVKAHETISELTKYIQVRDLGKVDDKVNPDMSNEPVTLSKKGMSERTRKKIRYYITKAIKKCGTKPVRVTIHRRNKASCVLVLTRNGENKIQNQIM
ncbi:hypothetical protein ECANGB1_1073 [Enterospora canceri]|uniref:Uncharacterized protein n=1 Tax=Enterospora canceri TaxID=1081671 RepID=A0A1Y1S6W8_9MICR|nr:hypothetical protein ECANGB1_1073 [Enterospora canceri]